MAASSSSLVSIEASFFENLKGFILAVVSSAFIGSSFIVKKLGLKRAGASGTQASSGGYGYLKEPLWWIGMITIIFRCIAGVSDYYQAPPQPVYCSSQAMLGDQKRLE
ncbi:probable magnesium transporter NIPA3 isoform X3 [Quercus lobata]|uniref:probable magnesium transporter NIPA3 isoform X3 n=1 Tax=Quercus lobata TaxID=97700 RepID=UPI001245106D|nr:probable magnesium transporter NIPA3 isoform X3 [Quercus lobata]